MARAAWVLLAAVVGGWSFGVAAASQVGGGILNAVLPPIGAAAGYWLARLGVGPDGPRPGRGQVKYWRGRAFHDDDR